MVFGVEEADSAVKQRDNENLLHRAGQFDVNEELVEEVCNSCSDCIFWGLFFLVHDCGFGYA